MRNRDRSRRPTGSAGSILSIGSSGSILSIGSAGSILSIGSAGSILSIGSAGSLASVLSVGSFASAVSVLSGLSRWSILAWRSRQPPAIPWPRSSQPDKALTLDLGIKPGHGCTGTIGAGSKGSFKLIVIGKNAGRVTASANLARCYGPAPRPAAPRGQAAPAESDGIARCTPLRQ